jgi:hypothetical protein
MTGHLAIDMSGKLDMPPGNVTVRVISTNTLPFIHRMKITNIHVHLIFFSLTLFFITNIIVANRKTNYNDLRTVSLNKTNCSYLINRTHLIVLSVVLRQQRGYLFLHTFIIFSLAKSKTGNNIYTEMTNMFCI